jgi:hypothetical protein
VCRCVPNGDRVAIVIRPTPAVAPARIKMAGQRHPHTPFLQLSIMHHLLCHAVVREYAKLRLDAPGARPSGDETWKRVDARATTGLAAVVMSLALCDKVIPPTMGNVLNNVLNSKPESVLNHCVKPKLVTLKGILSHSPPQAPLREACQGPGEPSPCFTDV